MMRNFLTLIATIWYSGLTCPVTNSYAPPPPKRVIVTGNECATMECMQL